MPTSENFCLRWNDFQKNVITAFRDLKEDSDFTDVTLACEDGIQVDAHKVVLASSSPFFQNLLQRNQHVHTLIYMRGIKSVDLLAMIDFLYNGEVNIYQENLKTFLKIADEFQLKGLNETEQGGNDADYPKKTYKPTIPSTSTWSKKDPFETEITYQNSSFFAPSFSEHKVTSNVEIGLPEDTNELDKQIEPMMSRVENMIGTDPRRISIAYACNVCGKEAKKQNMKDHIEANHLEGVSIPCKVCENTFR